VRWSSAELGQLSKRLGREPATGLDSAAPREVRRAAGAYFTPQPLVEFVVDSLLRWHIERTGPLRWRDDGAPDLRILDPASGDGRFLHAALHWLVRRAAEKGIDATESSIRERCLIGIERVPDYFRACQARLPGAQIHRAEALLSGTVPEGAVDLVLGNPPYLRSIHLGESDPQLWTALKGSYRATSHGEWDLYAAFLEQGLRWLRDGGHLALIVPTRWWTASWAGPLREHLQKREAVGGLLDFGAQQIFPGATTYAGVSFLSARPCGEVAVASRRESGWECDHLPAASFARSGTYGATSRKRRQLIDRMRSASRATLGEVARIAKGTGTNADRVFVVESWTPECPIEAELLRPVLRGRDVQAFGSIDESRRILCPYRRDGSFIDPAEMRQRYPRALAYLESHRERLEAREKGRFAGATFYRFGRPQNLRFLGAPEPKVVVPDVAASGRALLDCAGALVLDSAYALRPLAHSGLSAEHLLVLMNSHAVALWLRENGIPLRGGYLRLKTRYLEGLPLPERSQWDAAAAGVGDLRGCGDLLRQGYGLTGGEWNSANCL
jgi:hypothetical protein